MQSPAAASSDSTRFWWICNRPVSLEKSQKDELGREAKTNPVAFDNEGVTWHTSVGPYSTLTPRIGTLLP